MPFAIRKVPNKNCYRIRNTETGRIYAKCSTLENANAQLRLLRGIEYGNFKPTGKTRRRRSSAKRRSSVRRRSLKK